MSGEKKKCGEDGRREEKKRREEGSDVKSLWGNPFPLLEISGRFVLLKQRALRARTRLITV